MKDEEMKLLLDEVLVRRERAKVADRKFSDAKSAEYQARVESERMTKELKDAERLLAYAVSSGGHVACTRPRSDATPCFVQFSGSIDKAEVCVKVPVTDANSFTRLREALS